MTDLLFGPRRAQIAAVLAYAGGCSLLARAYQRESLAAGVGADELDRNRDGYAADARTQAALRFAHAALITRGALDRADLRIARRHGLHDDDLSALVALAAQTADAIIRTNAAGPLPAVREGAGISRSRPAHARI
jgi:hypothetical protein